MYKNSLMGSVRNMKITLFNTRTDILYFISMISLSISLILVYVNETNLFVPYFTSFIGIFLCIIITFLNLINNPKRKIENSISLIILLGMLSYLLHGYYIFIQEMK